MFRIALLLQSETLQLQIYGILRVKPNFFTQNCVLILKLFCKLLIMNDLNIKEIREKLGVSQETLAEMVGVHPRTIQNWESGTKIPKSKHAILRDLVLKPQNYAGGEQQNVHGDNINGNNVTVHKTDTDKLLEILASKEQSLAKAQEHIDKLLEIIGNLTKGNGNGNC